jgi:erythronate-4-phosphate dehydrogenase
LTGRACVRDAAAVRITCDAAIPGIEAAVSSLGDVRLLAATAMRQGELIDTDALVVRSVCRIDAQLLEGTRVRFVGSATIGTDHVDLEYLERAGVGFAHAPGCNALAVAQYVITAIHRAAVARRRSWAACTVGVVGFGNVGRRLTRLLRGLGLEVRVCDPPLAAREPKLDEDFVGLDAVLEECDVVSLHVPLTEHGQHATRDLLDNYRVQRLIAKGGLLINTSRGGVVDEGPLLAASGPGAAVIDTWAHEPKLRWELLREAGPVVIATPHVAGYTREGKRAATRIMAEALAAHLGAPAPASPAASDPLSALAAPQTSDALADFAAVLTSACDLSRDDEATRTLARLDPHLRPEAFRMLRDGYRLRRQFEHFEVSGAGQNAARLRSLGFAMASP